LRGLSRDLLRRLRRHHRRHGPQVLLGSFTEGRIAAKAAVKYVMEKGRDPPQVSEQEYRDLEKLIHQPVYHIID